MSESGTTAHPLSTSLPDPEHAENVEYDPSLSRLRELSDHLETTTEFGSPSYVSDQRSRNADRTKNAVDHDFDVDDYARIEEALAQATEQEMVCVDRRMGRHDDHSYVCRLYVPKEYGRIALAWAKLFEPIEGDSRPDPDFVTVQVPDFEE